MNESKFKISDGIVSAISYLTAGWGGVILLIICYFGKKSPSKFILFNVYQSIFVSLLYFVIATALGIILKIMSYIPIINYIAAQIAFWLCRPVLFDFSVLQLFMTGLIIYMTMFSLVGRYPRLYKISDIIEYHV